MSHSRTPDEWFLQDGSCEMAEGVKNGPGWAWLSRRPSSNRSGYRAPRVRPGSGGARSPGTQAWRPRSSGDRGESVGIAAVVGAAVSHIYFVEIICILSPPRRLERDLK
ncbi:hypothetical protein ANANG_G00187160 [Anguilla anguilla]|uniref:Uncharacterized protein n=1 Tax=Anguilla anguilla TaxID=7936 RepID=A0A9D3RRI5_ANGAN|nr:hypothetical protein ANANG_G00187160 [Anguilla anguilla]